MGGQRRTSRKVSKNRRSLHLALAFFAAITVLLTIVMVAWTASTLIGFLFEESAVTSNHRARVRPRNKRRRVPLIIHVTASQDTLDTFGGSGSGAASASNDEGLHQSAFCAPWTVNADSWWSRNPTWEIALQNTTHQCFSANSSSTSSAALDDSALQQQRRDLYRTLTTIQFPATCEHAIVKHVTGSGWGVDVSHVVDGLRLALQRKVPVFCAAPNPWQYAVGVHGSAAHRAACPTADWRCYFLPLTNCSTAALQQGSSLSSSSSQPKIRYNSPWRGFAPHNTAVAGVNENENDWTVAFLLQYATRPQNWLRERAVTTAASVSAELLKHQSTCKVLHVRRADVVLHGKFSRRYHAIAEYLHALDQQQQLSITNAEEKQNILLLTDDANAVTEAITKHSDRYNWFYLDRPRHQGASGGWENQIPSEDPVTEVVMLHAEFELVQLCDTLVHSKSNLADYLYAVMLLHNRHTVHRIDLDAHRPHHRIHSGSNADTVRLSTAA